MEKKTGIAIIMATRAEAAPFVKTMGLTKVEKSPLALFERPGLVLCVSGIGKTNAAIATAYCCATARPRWVLNLGAAGAAREDFRIGDIFHVTNVIEYDRPFLSRKGLRFHRPHVFSGYREATLATQDKPVISPDDRAAIAPFTDLVDMEGSAVVQGAHKFETPSVLFKFVSDTPAHTGEADILQIISHQGAAFCRFVTETVIPKLEEE
jgi:adenosylhomocysteine nucleosidase